MVKSVHATGREVRVGEVLVIERAGLQALLDAVRAAGYLLIGPTVRNEAVVYDEVSTVADLPAGWTDEQAGGSYRLTRRDDETLFGYTLSPQSWKRFLFPPLVTMWQAHRDGTTFVIDRPRAEVPRYAFLGVRACELAAIAIQDRVFLEGPYVDPGYKARREQALFIAVNCGKACGTCFCTSMQTGPQATTGFDLALTEVLEGGRHYFTVEVGTERGAALLRTVPATPAEPGEKAAAEGVVAATAAHMGRELDTTHLKEILTANYEHPRWDAVATRCLTCGNCTMVCPTCFCMTVEDVSDLAGQEATRTRHWDSCFNVDYSYIHGGSIRLSPKSRYRQWLMHKLATWHDQFGTSGCVGCGRCITWCPVGIDITEEAGAVRRTARPLPKE